eukprot:92371_1
MYLTENQVIEDICNGSRLDIDIKEHYSCIDDDMKRIEMHIHGYKQRGLERKDVLKLLDDYLHLIHEHNDDEKFEYIYNRMGHCDIKTCLRFRSNYINRHEQHDQKNNNGLHIDDNITLEIINKIHCYYCHSYDIGYRLRVNESINVNKHTNKDKEVNASWAEYVTNTSVTQLGKLLHKRRNLLHNAQTALKARMNKYNNLSSSNHDFIDTNDKNNMYQYGYFFKYWQHDDSSFTHPKSVKVSSKYSNLKKEV